MNALLTLAVVIPVFLASNWFPHKIVSQKIDLWPYVAFPVGAVVPWLLFLVGLYFKFPPDPDPAKHDFGAMPVLPFLAIIAVPIYYIAMAVGTVAFLENATILRRFLTSAVIASGVLVVSGSAAYFARFR